MLGFIWWRGTELEEIVHIKKSSVETLCGIVGSCWEDVPKTTLQKGTKNCSKCWTVQIEMTEKGLES